MRRHDLRFAVAVEIPGRHVSGITPGYESKWARRIVICIRRWDKCAVAIPYQHRDAVVIQSIYSEVDSSVAIEIRRDNRFRAGVNLIFSARRECAVAIAFENHDLARKRSSEIRHREIDFTPAEIGGDDGIASISRPQCLSNCRSKCAVAVARQK